MSLALDENQSQFQIRGYAPGRIQINDRIIESSIILTPSLLIDHWRPQQLTDLQENDFQMIIDIAPSILLLGTGSVLTFPDISLYGHLINLGIGIEIMDTPAACRTYAALAAEGRQVAAALIIQ